MTIKQALNEAHSILENSSDAHDIDSSRLLAHILQQEEQSWLHAHSEHILSRNEYNSFSKLVSQRQQGVPLAYLLGEAEFYGRSFVVTPDVLIPRPETEELVAQALAFIQDHAEVRTIADIGTGSGIAIISLVSEIMNFQFPISNFQFFATDISEAALDIARQNADRHGVSDRITFLQGDLLEPVQDHHVDLIVSNPPYVPSAELDSAHESVSTRGLLHEPRLALDGGLDGQDYVEELMKSSIPAIIETTNGAIVTNPAFARL